MLLQSFYYYTSLNLESSVFLSETLAKIGPDIGYFCMKANSTFIFYLPLWLDPLCLGFVTKDWTIKISQRSLLLTFNKALASASVPYS